MPPPEIFTFLRLLNIKKASASEFFYYSYMSISLLVITSAGSIPVGVIGIFH